MSTKLIFFSLIFFFTIPIHAMKRPHSLSNTKPHLQGIIEEIIVHHATEYPFEKKPKEATQTINTLAKTNKKFNALINNPDINNKILKNLTYNLYCSHETIARMLHTQQSKKQLKLQYDLKKICRSTYVFNRPGDRATLITEKLKELITQNVDLDFTYNHYDLQATPLMLAAKNSDSTVFELLLKRKVNINVHNSHGITLLKFLVEAFPIREDFFNHYKKFIKLPGLNINQQNRHGETALLRCLMSRKPKYITNIFISVIEELLEAGADPELTNNKGLTPLAAAQQLKNERIIDLIKLAIEQKHSTS